MYEEVLAALQPKPSVRLVLYSPCTQVELSVSQKACSCCMLSFLACLRVSLVVELELLSMNVGELEFKAACLTPEAVTTPSEARRMMWRQTRRNGTKQSALCRLQCCAAPCTCCR